MDKILYFGPFKGEKIPLFSRFGLKYIKIDEKTFLAKVHM